MKTKSKKIIDAIKEIANIRSVLSGLRKREAELKKGIHEKFSEIDDTAIEIKGMTINLEEVTTMVLDTKKICKALGVKNLDKYKTENTYEKLVIERTG